MPYMSRIFRIIFSLLLPLLCVSINAQDMKIPLDTNVLYGTLDNGLTYYIRHNAKPEGRAEFYIAQKVGSIQEEPQQRGLAHFLEHMAFNGTLHFPGDGTAPGIVEWCEAHAIKFGTNLNAYTSVDETVYNISGVPTQDESVLDSCLLILNDWSSYILLKDKDIDDERGVITEEWRSRNTGVMRVYTDAQSTLYPGSKYEDCMPIGSIDVIKGFPYSAIRDYYNTWYHPGNQGIIIVGDFDAQKMEQKVRELFGAIPKRQGAPERVTYPVPDNTEPLVYVGSDKEVDSPMISLFFKQDVFTPEEKSSVNYLVSRYALNLICSMLNVRFAELLETPQPPFTGASAAYGEYFLAKSKDAFEVDAACPPDGVDKAIKAVLNELERVRRYGFTQGEFQRATADYLQALENLYNERANTKNESFVNEYVSLFLDGEPSPGIEFEYALAGQIAPSLPLEAINSIAMGQILGKENIACLVAVPENALDATPKAQDIRSMIGAMSSLEVAPYEDTVSDEPLIKELPRPGSILSEEAGPFQTVLLKLSNGAEVYLKKTDFKDDQILLQGVSLGGTTLYENKEKLESNYLSSVATIGGLGSFSQVDLGKVLAGKSVSLDTDVSGMTESVSGSSNVRDLETMLQLLYLSFTDVRKDTDAFASFKNRLRAQLESEKANPLSTLNDTLAMTLYGNHDRLLFMEPELVEDINYDRILKMHRERFANAGDFSFFIIGNIDEEAIRPLICQYLASLPSTASKEQYVDRRQYVLPGVRLKEYVKHQETPMATVVMRYHAQMPYDLRNNLLMTMARQCLDMVFTQEIREKEGGTYGVSTSGSMSRHPRQTADIQIVYQTDPEKKDHLNELIYKIVEDMSQNGPSEQQLQNAKDYMLKSHADNLKENAYYLNLLQELHLNQTDMLTGFEQTVSAITRQDVAAFMKDLLKENNRVTVIMTDQTE